ncbi:MAG: FimV family protein [Candidatus Aquirickettsiella gammari]
MYKKELIIRYLRRFLLVVLPIACLTMVMLPAFALGLGEMRVRSSLGQSLLVHADVLGSDAETINPSCLRARVVTMDGVFIASANILIQHNQKRRVLSFSTRQAINEPAINLIIDINCETQLHREFSILLDPLEASSGAASIHRDESPFGKSETEVAKSSSVSDEALALASASKSATKKRTQKVRDFLADTAGMNDLPASASLPKKKKVTTVPVKDVLRLSDDIAAPVLPQGLRMSDVLSSDAGQKLVENMQELRAAQARMAAILRDEVEPASAVSEPTPTISKLEDSVELASLKRETEQLRKQNQLDKSALAQLQNKSGFDYWLLALVVVATLAIFIILFLLLYIRRNLSGQNATWWEGEDETHGAQPERIEDAINNLQASYDNKYDAESAHAGNASEPLEKRNSTVKPNAATKVTAEATSPSQALSDNSKFHRIPSLEETNSSIFNFFAPRGNSVKVEEISDVTQEAEFWISMNDPQRAIEILSAQEQLEHPDSPVPWLFLLDLYRTVNDQVKYDRLRDRFIVFFNANIPEFDDDLSQIPNRQLEDFPHLIKIISDAWGGNNIIPYLESLLVDDREGKRAGFDLPVYRDILMLLGIAHELDKIKAIEGSALAVPTQAPVVEAVKDVDHLADAEFDTIEFETIDFPIDEHRKK